MYRSKSPYNMKIIEIIPNLLCGGAENFLVNLSNEFAARDGYDVSILTLYAPQEGEFLREKVASNVKLIYLNKKPGIDLSIPYKIYKIIKHGEFSVAHFHVQAIIYALFSVLFYRKCKYYATIHSDAYKEATGLHRLVRRIMFRKSLCIPITISEESQRSFYKLYHQPSELIYNGVNNYVGRKQVFRDRFVTSKATKLFVYVASIAPLKNQVAFARCINQLFSEGYDVALLIIGRIVNKEYGELLLKEVSSVVHYLGEVDNPTDYMGIADFYALVSTYEGLPISLLEAFSTQCVPIVTPVGGCKDIVRDEENGFVAKSSSFDDICETTRRALCKSNMEIFRIKKMMEKEFVQKFTIKSCADSHLKLFCSTKNQ